MFSTTFNENWTVRPKTSIFAQIGSGEANALAVTLPHDALVSCQRDPSASGKNAYYPESSTFEYLKSFEVSEEWREKTVWLEFQGAYRDAMVFINDSFAGQRPYGYSIFQVPLDAFLLFGQRNQIRVEVRTHDDSRWYTGAGLIRDVILHVTDPMRFKPFSAHASIPDVDDERAVIELSSSVLNHHRHLITGTVVAEILDHAGDLVVRNAVPVSARGASSAEITQRLYLPAPHRWSVDDPYLYTVRLALTHDTRTLDSVELPLGVRTIRLDPTHGLRINDETVKLRGACVHHDNGPLGGAALAAAEERRVRLLKEAGFNAIRSAHNPLSVAMLDACDRLGMIVMDEAFDVWAESKSPFDYSLDFPEWWERDIESMVLKDRNHPSVIFYSIGNEIPETGSPTGAEVGRRLAQTVRRHDPHRFVTNGINGFVAALKDVMGMMRQATTAGDSGGVNDAMGSAGDMMNRISASELVTRKTEESFSVLDAAGINYGDGRYELDRELFPDRLIIGTETFPGHIDVLWPLVLQNSRVLGDFTWTGWDYLGEVGLGRVREPDGEDRSMEGPYPLLTAWSGDLDITGQRRSISYYRETVYGLRHEPYIAVHRPDRHGKASVAGGWSWPDAIESWTWSVPDGTPTQVDIYSDADEIELLVNGARVGRQPVGEAKKFIATFDTAYSRGEITAIAYLDGIERARSTVTTAHGTPVLAMSVDRVELQPTSQAAAFVGVSLVGTDGTLFTDVDVEVSVTVSGAGYLAGLGSGNPRAVDPLSGDHCWTFDGRLLAIIRPKAEGEILVQASAGDLRASAVLRVEPAAPPAAALGDLAIAGTAP